MVNPFDLTGKVGLVTGGNNGIGLAMASGLVKAGARVMIWGRNESKNSSAEETLRALGGDAVSLSVDVSDESAVVEAFDATVQAFGYVDTVFANAGVASGVTRFEDMTTEEWRYVFAVNMDGAFWTFREAVKHMKPRGTGSLIVTSSVSADMGFPRGEHYAATKAGVRSLIQGIAVEYGKYGIRANAISPGYVATGMTAGVIDSDQFAEKVLPRVPVGRFGKPDDFEGIAVYLASDASQWHTGDTITIDGGFLKK